MLGLSSHHLVAILPVGLALLTLRWALALGAAPKER